MKQSNPGPFLEHDVKEVKGQHKGRKGQSRRKTGPKWRKRWKLMKLLVRVLKRAPT